MDPERQKQSAKTGGGNTSDQFPMPKPQGDAEFWPLSGNSYFYVILGKSKRFLLPREVYEKLPSVTVPAKIVHRGKVWDLIYLGDQITKRFGSESWGKFVSANNLGVGDVCVFELMEGSSKGCLVNFKVQILRDDFPSELLDTAQGFSKNHPIDID